MVAAVQGDVPHARNLPQLLNDSTVTQNHAQATEKLAAQVKAGQRPEPDIVIWPENSTDLDPFYYPAIYQEVSGAVSAIGRPILVGEVLYNPQRVVGQLWLPGRGPTAIYAKRQLVPFGEVIPDRGLLSHITSLPALQPVNFTPGHRTVIFRTGKIRLGDVICYEIGFDGLVRSEVSAGANLLTMQTNDADFEVDGQTGESTAAAGHGANPGDRVRPCRGGRVHDRGERHRRAGRAADHPQRYLAAGGAGGAGPPDHPPDPGGRGGRVAGIHHHRPDRGGAPGGGGDPAQSSAYRLISPAALPER